MSEPLAAGAPSAAARTPESAASEQEERLAALLVELSERVQRGEEVSLAAECAAHPALAKELTELWGAVMLANLAGNSAADSRVISAANKPAEAMATRGTSGSGGSLAGGSLSLPCRFDDYELLEEIGRGGMGVVYRARQLSLDRIVAVKMILRGQLASPLDVARFQAEAEAAARLDHSGIVPVYAVGESDGRWFFSMKFVPGRTLSQVFAEGPIAPREAARLLAAVSRAIDYAHRRGVLHRDLKPSNILIDADDQPHVTDFGLAKREGDAASLTRSGAILGTPAYMAPEQAAGARGQVGPTSDVYSLGTILYHALTGRPPFQAVSPVDVVLMVLEQDPPMPRVLNPRVDRDLELVALRCLQKPQDLRYPSAAALANDLEAYLKDEPISARSGRFAQVLANLFRETHHAAVLENWGLLWIWHSLALIVTCTLTNTLFLLGVKERWYYAMLWTAGLGTWAAVFWALRRRLGPVLFVERQIAHIWGASMASIGLLFPLETMLGLPLLRLSPVLGIVSGSVFLVKAGILSGEFYLAAAALYATAFLMAASPDYAHFIFGAVSAACFFIPGLKYYRQRLRRESLRRETSAEEPS